MELLLILFLGLLTSYFSALVISSSAERLGLVDRPDHRSSHKRPTPKGGGVGILLFFIGLCLYLKISVLFWGPVALLSALSLLGDRVHIAPALRLFAQFAAVFVFIACNGDQFPSLSPLISGQLLVGIALFLLVAVFIVGTANLYNFMDGINGIAAITGFVGFGFLAVYALIAEKGQLIPLMCVGVAAANLGFLPLNVPQAKIFMGDVGSILLGFLYASLVLMMAANTTELLILTSFLFPFYADELVTVIERLRDGDSLLRPHRRHLYQVLANEAGIAHWRVALGYGIFQFFVGCCVWWSANYHMGLAVFFLLLFSGIFWRVNKQTKKTYQLWPENI